MNRVIFVIVGIIGAALPLGLWASYRQTHPEAATPPLPREPQIEVVAREPDPVAPALIPSTQVQPTTAQPVPPAPKPVAVAPTTPVAAPARRTPPNLPMVTVKVVPPPKAIRAKTVISVADTPPVAAKAAVKKPTRKPASTRRRHRRR